MSTPDRPGGDPEVRRTCLPAARKLGIAELAETRLRSNGYLALRNICCEYREGVLTLRGCLPTYYLKQVAQETVAGLAGARIDNQIAVLGSAPACVPERRHPPGGAARRPEAGYGEARLISGRGRR
jgi:hypothetical protein